MKNGPRTHPASPERRGDPRPISQGHRPECPNVQQSMARHRAQSCARRTDERAPVRHRTPRAGGKNARDDRTRGPPARVQRTPDPTADRGRVAFQQAPGPTSLVAVRPVGSGSHGRVVLPMNRADRTMSATRAATPLQVDGAGRLVGPCCGGSGPPGREPDPSANADGSPALPERMILWVPRRRKHVTQVALGTGIHVWALDALPERPRPDGRGWRHAVAARSAVGFPESKQPVHEPRPDSCGERSGLRRGREAWGSGRRSPRGAAERGGRHRAEIGEKNGSEVTCST